MTEKLKKIFHAVKSTVFADPWILYREERALLNEPFYFEGTNGKAVLLIHGWSSTPYEVRRLGTLLHDCGYTVHGPLLKGHGTVPKDLENVHWSAWLEDVERAYVALKGNHSRVAVAGTSIGSNLAILLAEQHPEISCLVLMATPYKVRMERMSVTVAKMLHWFKKYHRKFYPPTFGSARTITRLISYQTYPISSALETFELIKRTRSIIPRIQQPCFLLQSSHDHVVAQRSLEEIYSHIGSSIKQKEYVRRAYHTFISDIRNEHVFQSILEFINTYC